MKEYKIKVNGNQYSVTVDEIDDNVATVTVNGVQYKVDVEGTAAKPKTPKLVRSAVTPSTDYHPATSKTNAPEPAQAPSGGGAGAVKSPLPGTILEVVVREGDSVTVGQKLLVLEAMKMENNIESDKAGVVKRIVKQKGDSVLEGDVLIEIG